MLSLKRHQILLKIRVQSRISYHWKIVKNCYFFVRVRVCLCVFIDAKFFAFPAFWASLLLRIEENVKQDFSGPH